MEICRDYIPQRERNVCVGVQSGLHHFITVDCPLESLYSLMHTNCFWWSVVRYFQVFLAKSLLIKGYLPPLISQTKLLKSDLIVFINSCGYLPCLVSCVQPMVGLYRTICYILCHSFGCGQRSYHICSHQ